MEDANNVDHVPLPCPIHDEMATVTTTTRNMERSKIGENFITRDAAEDIWPLAERGQSFKERRLVNLGLLMAEPRFCVGQNPSKILLGLGAEANLPRRLCQVACGAPERTRSPRSCR